MDGLEARQLYVEPFTLAMPAQHRLAKKKDVKVEDLKDETLLLLEDGHCLRDQALEVCKAAGAEESQEVRATSLNTLAQMVANGLGITLLPGMAVPVESAAAHNLVIRRFREPAPGRKIGLMWRASSPREKEFRLLGELIARVVDETAAQPSTARSVWTSR